MLSLDFQTQASDFGFQGQVFGFFALEEVPGDLRLLLDALGGEQVGVSPFVLAGAKVLDLDPAFLDQGAHAKVGRADADAQCPGQGALGEVGVGLQQAQGLEVALFANGGAAPGGWGAAR